MKRLLTILLLFCIFLELGGYFLIYQYNRELIKKEVKAYLKYHANEFEQSEFRFPMHGDEKPEWENQDEFSYRDEMYDVIEKHTDGDQVYIRCVKDEKENQLIKNFRQLIRSKDSKERSSDNNHFNLLSLLNSPFLPVTKTFPDYLPVSGRIHFFEKRVPLLSHSPEIQTPPPKALIIC